MRELLGLPEHIRQDLQSAMVSYALGRWLPPGTAPVHFGNQGQEMEEVLEIGADEMEALMQAEDDDMIEPIDNEDPFLDEVYLVAKDLVEEQFDEDCELLRTAVTLTISGEIDFDDDDAELGELSDDEDAVQVLAEFEYEDKQYDLVRVLDPMLLLGKPTGEGANVDGQEIFELLQGESGEQIAQQVEVALDAVEAYEEGLDEED